MSSNPNPAATATLTRPVLEFCLARRKRKDLDFELICTRLNDHSGHCCDETAGMAWTDDGRVAQCAEAYDHSTEKGLRG